VGDERENFSLGLALRRTDEEDDDGDRDDDDADVVDECSNRTAVADE